MKRLLEDWLDFLLPKFCLICRKENDNFLCFECFKKISWKNPVCPACGSGTDIGQYCQSCRNQSNLKGVLVAGNYHDPVLKTLIKNYKYRLIKDLSRPLATLLILFLKNNFIPNPILNLDQNKKGLAIKDFLLLPLPLSKQRQRWRGFNQTELLARLVAKKLNLKISLDLKRIKDAPAQAKLSYPDRRRNLADNFRWTGPLLSNQKILLLDDVCASGASLNEAAKELKKHQAAEIWGLVLAKD